MRLEEKMSSSQRSHSSDINEVFQSSGNPPSTSASVYRRGLFRAERHDAIPSRTTHMMSE